ncbi:MAG: hypothetical protein F4138_00450 [Acidimicrobiia bacterium]|nr:hypothetical protein [Acidimicrobiia bacterium]
MDEERSDLYFGVTHQPCGFTSGVVAQFDGSEEPVVRELIQNSLDALLTQGNTSKGDQGAGSFGLGHHAAFGASDLRYVLYAARFRTEDGELASIASGHTILASHRDTDSPSGSIFAADGYWFRRGQGESAFDGTDSSYPSEPPSMLAPHLDDMHDTGTVVCVAGFNDFRRDEDDPVSAELICCVAAANFSVAVHESNLIVRVKDERQDLELDVTRENLGRILKPISGQRRAPKQGQIRGELAYNAWKTISEGLSIELAEGESLRIRHLPTSGQQPTRVHVFRRGMWIDSQVQGLRDSDFAKALPFDAVLMLDQGSDLEELVRSAEGPEHRGVDRKRLDEGQKGELRKCLEEIARRLRREVGKREDREEFTPPGFASIFGHELRAAEPALRPRLPSGGGQDLKPVEGGEVETKAGEKKIRRAGVPRPGSVPSYRSSSRPGKEAQVVEFHLVVDEEIAESFEVGIRLRLVSGSDGTCEQPLSDIWVPLLEVSDGKSSQRSEDSHGGDLELTLPLGSGEQQLTITTTAPISQLELLELDLVRRQLMSE